MKTYAIWDGEPELINDKIIKFVGFNVQFIDAEKPFREFYKTVNNEYMSEVGMSHELFKICWSLPIWKLIRGEFYRLQEGSGPFAYEEESHTIKGYFRSFQDDSLGGEDTIQFSFTSQPVLQTVCDILTRREAEQLAGLSSVAFQYHLANNHIYPAKEVGKGNGKVQLFWRADVDQLIKEYIK